CNTASAKALRTIQQEDLPRWDASRRVLGVIRPTVENLEGLTRTGHIGIFATPGTVRSETYELEIAKLYGDRMTVVSEACPMWVPLVENHEHESEGADYFVRQHVEHILRRDPQIDCILLGCTHYPLLEEKIRRHLPSGVHVVSQGHYVAASLQDYLHRHSEMESRLTRGGTMQFLTTDKAETFAESAAVFMGGPVAQASRVSLG
ncbi:MAG: aspartate/glutamate racemase family protein, partial [Bacteroidaceae bacterium]|nr:aspartate/glutamate racemase family protein [Bacteroidaceae bacterium]